MDCTGRIFDVKRYAIHDGPGIRTTLFFKGCPLRCTWCHNPESWASQPEPSWRVGRCQACSQCVEVCEGGAIHLLDGQVATDATRCVRCGRCVAACPGGARELIGREVSVSWVLHEIEKDVAFFDESGGGVTFSGGEPLAQPDFLNALLQACAERDIHTAVDTTLHASPEIVDEVAQRADVLLCDLKHMDSDTHERLTGVPNGLILENLRRCAASTGDSGGRGGKMVVRIPVVPGVNDDEENLDASGAFVSSLGVEFVDLLRYHAGGRDKAARLSAKPSVLEVVPADDAHLRSVARRLQRFGFSVRISGESTQEGE